jgi:hypothetical protein
MSLPRFHLELHLPYFTLQPESILDSASTRMRSDLRRKSMDLSFLQESMENVPSENLMVAYETHVSVVLFGSAERQWTAYCFEDCHSEDEELANSVRQPQCPTVHMDPILNGTRDADVAVWDPRMYFILVCDVRFSQACHHWETVVILVEKCLNRYVSSVL